MLLIKQSSSMARLISSHVVEIIYIYCSFFISLCWGWDFVEVAHNKNLRYTRNAHRYVHLEVLHRKVLEFLYMY